MRLGGSAPKQGAEPPKAFSDGLRHGGGTGIGGLG